MHVMLTFYSDICSTVHCFPFIGCGYTCVYSCCITMDVNYIKVPVIRDNHSLRVEPLYTGKWCWVSCITIQVQITSFIDSSLSSDNGRLENCRGTSANINTDKSCQVEDLLKKITSAWAEPDGSDEVKHLRVGVTLGTNTSSVSNSTSTPSTVLPLDGSMLEPCSWNSASLTTSPFIIHSTHTVPGGISIVPVESDTLALQSSDPRSWEWTRKQTPADICIFWS